MCEGGGGGGAAELLQRECYQYIIAQGSLGSVCAAVGAVACPLTHGRHANMRLLTYQWAPPHPAYKEEPGADAVHAGKQPASDVRLLFFFFF